MDQKQFEAMLSDAESRLRRLKQLYDQWFMGFERTEPAVLRKELDDLLGRLRKEQSNNTALRFRLQQLVQRYTTFTTHWRRIGRQIEEGTYQRDVIRAKRMKPRAGADRDGATSEPELSYDVDIDIEIESALDEVERAVEEAPAKGQRPIAAAEPAAAPELQPARAAVSRAGAVALPPPAAKGSAGGLAPKGGLGLPQPPAASGAALGAVPQPAAMAAAPARAAGPRSLSPFAMPAQGKPNPAAKTPASAGNGGAAPGAAKAAPVVAMSRSAAANAQPAAANASAAAARDAASFSTDDVQRVYTQYIAARKQNAERTDNVKRDTIEKTIRTMLPQLEKKHAGKRIDFEVVVKDGKVALKPVAR